MYTQPDYSNARAKAGFSWHVGALQGALRAVSGIAVRDFNLKSEACITAFQQGSKALRELFGDGLTLPEPATPAISYGHVNGLGSELLFPEGGEVAHTHIYASLEEGVARLRQPVDFAQAGMAPFYLDFLQTMQRAFAGRTVRFGYGLEGPLTTAWELRGTDLLIDLYDQPETAQAFLQLVTESILEFHRFQCKVTNAPEINPTSSGLADDIAAMIPPALFPRFVLPYWEQYYRGRTTGERQAHVEDLSEAQLGFLEEIGLSYFDPSISPKLNPPLLSAACRVPYTWRLGSFHFEMMSEQDVEDFVYQSVADGASSVFCYVEENMVREPNVGKVKAFMRAAGRAEQLLKQHATVKEVGTLVSPAGRVKFWKHWPE